MLDRAELGTVLAALRLYQREGYGEPFKRPDWMQEIATDGDTQISLDAAGIDALCERLNTSALAAQHPRQTPKMIKIVCSTCGSGDVLRDSWAVWDMVKQDWVLSSVHDAAHCNKCDGETSLDEQSLIGCQHGEHEDCMTCVDCGECREDLDEDDRCAECRGEEDEPEPVDGRPMIAADIGA